jgi:methylated-DNA-[protein]-cysteine S-methyltransferase
VAVNKAVCYYHSPVGWLQIVAKGDAISAVSFVSEEGESVGISPLLDVCVQQLEAYFAGELKEFSVPLSFEGTPFQQCVWTALQQIPFGATWSYGELAERVGRSKAYRAVGGANNRNPIAILVPCHRVVGASGALTGYAGGLERKQALLEHEQRCIL